MADDRDLVLAGHIVGDHIDADPINPVVVDLVVLTRDLMPVDGPAIVLGVLDQVLDLGVDQRLELEVVGAFAAHEHVVTHERLVGPVDELERLGVD